MRQSARRRYNKKVARIGRKAEETGGNVPQKTCWDAAGTDFALKKERSSLSSPMLWTPSALDVSLDVSARLPCSSPPSSSRKLKSHGLSSACYPSDVMEAEANEVDPNAA